VVDCVGAAALREMPAVAVILTAVCFCMRCEGIVERFPADEPFGIERLVPFIQVFDRGVDAARPGRIQQEIVWPVIPPPPQRTIGDRFFAEFRLGLVVHQCVLHVERNEDSAFEKNSERHPRNFFDDYREKVVAGVAVPEPFAWGEFEPPVLNEPVEDIFVQPSFRIADQAEPVGKPRRMRQEMPDRYLIPRGGDVVEIL